MAKDNRGGARPGAGRKPQDPDTKRVQMVVTVAPETWQLFVKHKELTKIPAGRLIDLFASMFEMQQGLKELEALQKSK